ncbi:tetratricopeptide repeat protein 39C-like isoform X1 [Aphidius gifuensis]|uniref:tetratricopeptide repeat protein 39C-like isoform X1 n=1 Tax=Aphidius gifuensis TaxID=684658 RepID=UPI001CDC063A|nr:tetratricopeptide repeat protein 39C-like isoform X1 [Aphidius gifuensis]
MASSEPDWCFAKKGLKLFLNNKPDEAEILFAQRPDSFHIKTARCYMLFMNALMTFENDKLEEAVKLLNETERECVDDVGWFKTVKNRVFNNDKLHDDYGKKLENQIVLADTQVCAAMLVFLQQEVSSYVRGGWMMRKAWKIYQQTYLQLFQLYKRTFGINPSGFNGDFMFNKYKNSNWSIDSCNSTPSTSTTTASTILSKTSSIKNSLSMIFSLTNTTNSKEENFVEPAEVVRLMSAVSFGYGIFQLCVSLVPQSLLKVIHFLGFEGDRRAGLTALMYARLSEDMRAPLATLSLLCYHTIIRPFCSFNESNIKCGVDAAKQLLNECQDEYHDSALFLFFTGRAERLKSNINAALEMYNHAMNVSTQREIRLLCLHEVAWCHVICLNYTESYNAFSRLQNESRWCESVYAYIACVCAGSIGKIDVTLKLYSYIKTMISVNSKNTQLDTFILRRLTKLVKPHNNDVYSCVYYKILVYELLYLWNAMSSCADDCLQNIITECNNCGNDEPMVGLASLISGACYTYLNDNITSIKCFKNCLNKRIPSNDHDDQHVSTFALYELGNNLCKINKIDEGKASLVKAQSQYTNYDFESRLSVKIHSALKIYNTQNL